MIRYHISYGMTALVQQLYLMILAYCMKQLHTTVYTAVYVGKRLKARLAMWKRKLSNEFYFFMKKERRSIFFISPRELEY